MLQILRTARPEDYPTISRSHAKAALWTAFPAAIISGAGRVLAANKLGSWIAGLYPARQLLTHNIYELSAQLLVQGRIPGPCNLPFIDKKMENLKRIDPAKELSIHHVFSNLYEAARTAPSSLLSADTCTLSHSPQTYDERSPWQYPLRIRRLTERSDEPLLGFAVVEARLSRTTQLLIVIQPDDAEAKKMMNESYIHHNDIFPDEEYAFSEDGFDITVPKFYNHRDLRKPDLRIVTARNMRELKTQSKTQEAIREDRLEGEPDRSPEISARPPLSGVPAFELRPGQLLGLRDIRRICKAIDAEYVAVPAHPVLGPPDSFKLNAPPRPGRVERIDIFLRSSIAERGVATVHRLDDLGESLTHRYLFDIGHLNGEPRPAVSFVSLGEGTGRAVTVYNDGGFAEVEGHLQHLAAPGGPPARGAEAADWLTMREAATAMGISWSYAKKMIDNGELPAVRRGKMWFVDPAAAAAFRRKRAPQHA